jgi:hypothetical protein
LFQVREPGVSLSTIQPFENQPDREQLYEAYRLRKSDPELALHKFRVLAEQGSVMSMIYIGNAYNRAMGVKIDRREAEKWFRRAAEKGLPLAYHKLGVHYLRMEEDVSKSWEAFEAGASLNYAPSLYVIGKLYISGLGCEKNPTKGAEFLVRAVKLGHLGAKAAYSKYLRLRVSHLGFRAWLYGVWLLILFYVQSVYVLLKEGFSSDRVRGGTFGLRLAEGRWDTGDMIVDEF